MFTSKIYVLRKPSKFLRKTQNALCCNNFITCLLNDIVVCNEIFGGDAESFQVSHSCGMKHFWLLLYNNLAFKIKLIAMFPAYCWPRIKLISDIIKLCLRFFRKKKWFVTDVRSMISFVVADTFRTNWVSVLNFFVGVYIAPLVQGRNGVKTYHVLCLISSELVNNSFEKLIERSNKKW